MMAEDIHFQRLTHLRNTMTDMGLDGFIIPQTDAWQAESLHPCDERFQYMCGLDASAGFVVVTHDKAAILIDGRYTVAAKEQVNQDLFEIAYYTDILPEDWAKDHMPDNGILGYDPWLHTRGGVDRMANKDIDLKAVTHNPVNAIWDGQPSVPQQQAIIHNIKFAGKTVSEKLEQICENLETPYIITAPDSLAWLLNVRVLDNTEAPGLRGYGLLNPAAKSLDVFTDVDCSAFTESQSVAFHPLSSMEGKLQTITGEILLPQDAPAWFDTVLEQVETAQDPCALPKACKNETEQNGIRTSHKRDAIAVINTINWLKNTNNITERDVEARLIEERSKHNLFRGVSFDSIVGWNANGAAIHRTLTEDNNTKLEGDGLLLIDSGAQYDDGTTDITRTIALGTPTQDMKEKYTLVLKAHIALATAIFPDGTTGEQLDALVRAPLWQAGIDFAHGTGHGVGHFLNVHEGPANISPKAQEPLKPGMLLSNEPGYYKEGAFGIRLENLILVQIYLDKNDPKNETNRDLYYFETVTLVPFEDDCILRDLLSEQEQEWLDAYQGRC